jgi:predicted acetyltransferase
VLSEQKVFITNWMLYYWKQKNIGSIRVLEKIGLTFKSTFDFDGQEGVIYQIEKNK